MDPWCVDTLSFVYGTLTVLTSITAGRQAVWYIAKHMTLLDITHLCVKAIVKISVSFGYPNCNLFATALMVIVE